MRSLPRSASRRLPHAIARRALAAGWLLLALGLGGCPSAYCPTTPIGDPAQALRLHRSLHRTIRVVRGEARVDQRGSEGRVRGTVLVFLERPNRIRFDAMTQFGPAAILTSDGDDFQLLDMRENRFFQGQSTPENIARLLGVAMGGEDVARFLIGDTPHLPAADNTLQCGGDGYVIERAAPSGFRQRITLHARGVDRDAQPEAQHLRLVRSELFDAEGHLLWRASFDDFQVVRDPEDSEGRGVALPFYIRFEDPRREADTVVRFKRLEITHEAPPAETFHQDVPPGVSVESL